ncbi:Hypothetical protein ORPV_1180 [Orpheovirus IHUMI-LCC2]|uniref:Uncharacterized protein n=1 Tax=Orpheovirus IHUMI-LCC2 TaxID=2023057 RepID=A0A2I2L6C4_9VIRU|nr:Hypothetical protein ORPV_1180 [Orpheovirus IHUMI-LCC2]SNW63084.1 Hypothetical protein ORPV_1180 [Orpheovirus IHUMI-LCC2]
MELYLNERMESVNHDERTNIYLYKNVAVFAKDALDLLGKITQVDKGALSMLEDYMKRMEGEMDKNLEDWAIKELQLEKVDLVPSIDYLGGNDMVQNEFYNDLVDVVLNTDVGTGEPFVCKLNDNFMVFEDTHEFSLALCNYLLELGGSMDDVTSMVDVTERLHEKDVKLLLHPVY